MTLRRFFFNNQEVVQMYSGWYGIEGVVSVDDENNHREPSAEDEPRCFLRVSRFM
jgi:hypothetical protein